MALPSRPDAAVNVLLNVARPRQHLEPLLENFP